MKSLMQLKNLILENRHMVYVLMYTIFSSSSTFLYWPIFKILSNNTTKVFYGFQNEISSVH